MKLKYCIVGLYFLIFYIFFPSTCEAYPTAVTRDGNVINIESGIQYREDSAFALAIGTIVDQDSLFHILPAGTPNMGNSKSRFWLKLKLVNESNSNHVMLRLPNPALDSITVYDLLENNKVRIIHSGEFLPFADRPFHSSDYIFNFLIPKGVEKTVYLRISSSDLLFVPILMGTQNAILDQDKSKDIFWGIYIGLMISMLAYNVFIYISTKDHNYLFYILYVIAVLIAQITISGFGYQLFWAKSPGIAFYSPFITPCLAGITGVEFARRFLLTKNYIPKTDKLFIVVNLLYVIGFLFALSGRYSTGLTVIDITASLVALLILTSAIRIVWIGYRPAIYFLIAWGVFLVGVIVFVLKNFGILPYNTFTSLTMPVGSAMEVILLSFALADKINILKKEKAVSQAQALRESQKNSQLIQTQNIILETKVKERTLELYTLNEELESTLSNLKGAQAQLVESEKMASLGQLTAGIAHEINNPINFVISNVKPLKRDIAMLVDIFSQIETLVQANPADKHIVDTINKVKEEIEYDYLTTEIDFLLKGITEGSERTAEIVKGLRIFARVDEFDLKTTNVHDGIDSTIIIVNTLLSDKIIVEKDYASNGVIECYPGKLNQAFLNIISNGIHAVKSRWQEKNGGKISIKTWIEGESFNISIKDNGCGMPEEVGNKIFEPFYSTKEVGEGTGLGLSIAYNIIKKHNGQIAFNSKIGEGTEFILTIPVNQ